MKTAGLLYLPEADGVTLADTLDQYLERLSQCQIYERSGAVDFAVAADLCSKLLNKLWTSREP